MLCRFQKSQQSLFEERVPITKHGFVNRFYDRKCHVFIHGWIQWVQSDQNGTKGCRENCFQNTHRKLLLHCDAFRVKKHRCNLSTSNDGHISRYDASEAKGLCGWHSGEIKEEKRTPPCVEKGIREVQSFQTKNEPSQVKIWSVLWEILGLPSSQQRNRCGKLLREGLIYLEIHP